MPDPVCTVLGIPDHLHQDGKAPDDSFEEDELLYRRFKVAGSVEAWKKDSSLSVAVFEIKNDSFNRSKYSRSEDVLYNDNPADHGRHYKSFGYLSLPVSELSEFTFTIIQNKVERTYTIVVKHTPNQCNYAHSEIFVYEGDELVESNKPKSMKVSLRAFLLEKASILKASNFQ